MSFRKTAARAIGAAVVAVLALLVSVNSASAAPDRNWATGPMDPPNVPPEIQNFVRTHTVTSAVTMQLVSSTNSAQVCFWLVPEFSSTPFGPGVCMSVGQTATLNPNPLGPTRFRVAARGSIDGSWAGWLTY
jgi:hypothetical protein